MLLVKFLCSVILVTPPAVIFSEPHFVPHSIILMAQDFWLGYVAVAVLILYLLHILSRRRRNKRSLRVGYPVKIL